MTDKYNPDDYRTIAFASIGHSARVSNLVMTKEQSIYFDLAIQDLKKVLDDMYPNWETLNLELKEKVK